MSTDNTDTTDVPTPPAKRVDADTLRERLTDNAYENILPARYLRSDEDGELIEEQEDLFRRVAKNVAIAEAIYTDDPVTITPDEIKPDHPSRDDLIADVFLGDLSEHEDGEPVYDATYTELLTEENAKWVAYDPLYERCEEQGWDDTKAELEHASAWFWNSMESLDFVPNSPCLSNAGSQFQQLSACFVDSPADDIADINQTQKEASLVMQSGGGMGYAFSYLRPYGDVVGSSGGIASGPVSFMRLFDQMCAEISQGGMRRGAQMGVLRCTHPDLPLFINAKQPDVSLAQTLLLNDPDDPTHTSFAAALDEARELLDQYDGVPEHLRNAAEGHLSNFNISIAITDEFMDAALAGETVPMINPRTGEVHVATEHTEELYEMFGLGDEVEVGEPLHVDASRFLDMLVEGAHQNGEPGVLFIDRANEDHAFPATSTPGYDTNGDHELHATNPCGEQWLEEYGACNLGHINLSTIVQDDAPAWPDFDADEFGSLESAVDTFLQRTILWDELIGRIDLGTRFLDNVVTMSAFPVDAIEEQTQDRRKIGLGIMGLAEFYIQLGVQYGSAAGNEIARQLMRNINQRSKCASHALVKDRGVFGSWDESKFADPVEHAWWFERQTGLDPYDWQDGYTVRNYNTTTVAPTGTTSMVGNTTGGCEPIYNVAFYKNVSDDVQGDEMLVEFNDLFLRTLEATDGIDVAAVQEEAEALMAANDFDGIASLSSVPDELARLFITADELSGVEHASVQCALQEGVDSAISKTVNCSNHVDRDYVREVVTYLYENGAKGATIYRDGSRSKQVKTTRADNQLDGGDDLSPEQARERVEALVEAHDLDVGSTPPPADESDETPAAAARSNGHVSMRDRPNTLVGETQRISTGYGKVYVTVNEDDAGRPFELFVNTGDSGGFTNGFVEAIAKLASTALRAGVAPDEVAEAMTDIHAPNVGWDRGVQISSIPDGIGTALERSLDPDAIDEGDEIEVRNVTPADVGGNPQCPDCGAESIYYAEGCKHCETCGWSQC